jgi:hypothetical protein
VERSLLRLRLRKSLRRGGHKGVSRSGESFSLRRLAGGIEPMMMWKNTSELQRTSDQIGRSFIIPEIFSNNCMALRGDRHFRFVASRVTPHVEEFFIRINHRLCNILPSSMLMKFKVQGSTFSSLGRLEYLCRTTLVLGNFFHFFPRVSDLGPVFRVDISCPRIAARQWSRKRGRLSI